MLNSGHPSGVRSSDLWVQSKTLRSNHWAISAVTVTVTEWKLVEEFWCHNKGRGMYLLWVPDCVKGSSKLRLALSLTICRHSIRLVRWVAACNKGLLCPKVPSFWLSLVESVNVYMWSGLSDCQHHYFDDSNEFVHVHARAPTIAELYLWRTDKIVECGIQPESSVDHYPMAHSS